MALRPSLLVCFCESYQVDLEKYTLVTGRSQPLSSETINSRIERLYSLVVYENGRIRSSHGLFPATPFLSNAIFRMKIRKTRFGSSYARPQHNSNRLYDGIHPNNMARERIVRSLVAAINKDFDKL